MRRIQTLSLAIVLLMFGAVSLAGCSTVIGQSAQADDDTVTPINLSDQTVIDGLCDANPNSPMKEERDKVATTKLDAFQAVMKDLERYEEGGSARDDKITEIKDSWGIDPSEPSAVAAATAALQARVKAPCINATNNGSMGANGYELADGTITSAATYSGTGAVVTSQANNPELPALVSDERLFNREYRGDALAGSWTEVQEIAEQKLADGQWYINGVNQLVADGNPTFTWDQIKTAAKAEKQYGKDFRVIFADKSTTSNTDDQLRHYDKDGDGVSEIRQMLEDKADTAAILRYDDSWIVHNTARGGGFSNPQIVSFVDNEPMVRVMLAMPKFNADGTIWLNTNGEPVIDDENGVAGIFVDCLNIAWVVKIISTWQCTGSSCAPPPEQVCPWNPALPVGSPNCKEPPHHSDAKDNSLTPDNSGWSYRGTDNGVTDGRESARQQESGDTRGNGGEHQVGGNTGSGDNTSSTGNDVTVGGSTPGGDSPSGTVQDPNLVKDDKGGTEGATCVDTPLVSCSGG